MEYVTDVPADRTSTGLDNRKMLMWAFLGSDVMFFGSLIATHLIYRSRSAKGPAEGLLKPDITAIATFVLLLSSLAMVLALVAIQRGDIKRFRLWLILTATCGMIFIGFQMVEFSQFALDGLTPRTNVFGSSFLILTGFHGAHVTVGILWLWSLFFASFKGKVRQDNALNVELAMLYWHFVDIVWVVIFAVVYLVGAFGSGHAAAASIMRLTGTG